MDDNLSEASAAQIPNAASEADFVRTGSRLSDRYVVGDAIGRGGMAMVYHGHDELLDRDVAVKVLGPIAANAIGSRQAFLREARAAAALSHPNIVGVYDAGVHGSERFIVMEYVPGGSLADIIQAEAPLRPNSAVRIASQIADALDYGHRRGIIHCDVKPQNVLIDESGRPKLVDFGISRSIAATGALTDTISGTAGYIAPEQLLGDPIDGRADIYALGCVVYEMLCSELPFEGSNLAALATQRLVRPPIPLQQKNPALPAALAESVMQAIERDREQRYSTARDFARALNGSLRGPDEGRSTREYQPPRPVNLRPQETTAVERPTRPREAPASGLRLFWPLTLVSLGVLLLAGALIALHLPSFSGAGAGPPVAVPKVVDERLDQAARELHDAGFAIAVNFQDTTDETICNGKVLDQDPKPPTSISRGSTVTLAVSRSDRC